MVDPGQPDREEITTLLHRAADGDKAAADELMQSIERELRKIASIHMSRERPNHTLQTTALVNEAFIRLLGKKGGHWNDRQHFLSTASRVMRRFLVDYARRSQSAAIPLDLAHAAVGPVSAQVLDIHKALEELELIAPRQAELVELRFFGGRSLEEAAEMLGIAPRTADIDWKLARTWIEKRLSSISRKADSTT
jgi:RNA polymerase sigma-70 factor (ECF subfamily)